MSQPKDQSPGLEHCRRLEALYHQAACNQYYAPRMVITPGQAQVSIQVEPKYFHGGGAVHGSVYFKLLDDACFFAVNSLVEEVMVLTTSFHLHFLRPISQGAMLAKGQVVSPSPANMVAEGVLYDGKERVIARGSGTFVRGRKPLGGGQGGAGEK